MNVILNHPPSSQRTSEVSLSVNNLLTFPEIRQWFQQLGKLDVTPVSFSTFNNQCTYLSKRYSLWNIFWTRDVWQIPYIYQLIWENRGVYMLGEKSAHVFNAERSRKFYGMGYWLRELPLVGGRYTLFCCV